MRLLLSLLATSVVASSAEFNYHTYWEILPATAGTVVFEQPAPYWESTSTNSNGDLISINNTGWSGWTVKNKVTGEETVSSAEGLSIIKKVLSKKDKFLAVGDSMPRDPAKQLPTSSLPGKPLGGWDVTVANISPTGVFQKAFSFGGSGDDRFLDAVLVGGEKLLLAFGAGSSVSINSASPWVVRILLVSVATGAVLGESTLPHSGEAAPPNFKEGKLLKDSKHKFTYVAPTGVATNLYLRHILRVTTFSVTGEPYTVSESADLLNWTSLKENTKEKLVWDIPMIGEGKSGYLKFE